MEDWIDSEGFRANVGIILCNRKHQLFWAGRAGRRGWQFPQGGIARGEKPLEAMYRELGEEVGLSEDDVTLLGGTHGWLRYRLPRRYIRRNGNPVCIGQKQRWFLLGLKADEARVQLDTAPEPEFDRWRWVDFWDPVSQVIYFKRHVYERALKELGPLLFPDGLPPRPPGRAKASRANAARSRSGRSRRRQGGGARK